MEAVGLDNLLVEVVLDPDIEAKLFLLSLCNLAVVAALDNLLESLVVAVVVLDNLLVAVVLDNLLEVVLVPLVAVVLSPLVGAVVCSFYHFLALGFHFDLSVAGGLWVLGSSSLPLLTITV